MLEFDRTERAARVVQLTAQFHEALKRKRVREDEIKAVLDTPQFREVVVSIVDEVIKARIGVV